MCVWGGGGGGGVGGGGEEGVRKVMQNNILRKYKNT